MKTLEEYKKELNPEPEIRFKSNYKKEQALASEVKRHRNRIIRDYYYDTLEAIKNLIKKLPDQNDRLVYERCRIKEKGNLENVYDFFSPQIRFHLICWFDLNYQIHYSIGDSPLKDYITKEINLGIELNLNLIGVPLKPDFKTYYQKAMIFKKDYTSFL